MNITKIEVAERVDEEIGRDIIVLHTDLPMPILYPEGETPGHVILAFAAPGGTGIDYVREQIGIDILSPQKEGEPIEATFGIVRAEVLRRSKFARDTVNLYTDLPDPFPGKGISVVLQFETPGSMGAEYVKKHLGLEVSFPAQKKAAAVKSRRKIIPSA